MTIRKMLLLKRQHGEYSNKVILVFGMPDLSDLTTQIIDRSEEDEFTEGEWYNINFQKVIAS